MQFVVAASDPFLSEVQSIEATVDPEAKYAKTMRMLMNREIRSIVGNYLDSHRLSHPRNVLAMIMVALNYSVILDLSAPQDMIVRAEAERFFPVFKAHYTAKTNPTICVQRALEAFCVWKEADKEKIIAFTQDQIARHRLMGEESSNPPSYWARILVNAGANLEEMRSLYAPLQVQKTTLPSANPGQLFAAVEDHVAHPYLKQFVRLRAPNGPCVDEEMYVRVLGQFLSLVHGREIAGKEEIQEAIH